MVRLRQQNSSFLLLEASHIKRKIDGNSYLINRNLYIKENIDETVFMFALFKCRKSDKGRN